MDIISSQCKYILDDHVHNNVGVISTRTWRLQEVQNRYAVSLLFSPNSYLSLPVLSYVLEYLRGHPVYVLEYLRGHPVESFIVLFTSALDVILSCAVQSLIF